MPPDTATEAAAARAAPAPGPAAPRSRRRAPLELQGAALAACLLALCLGFSLASPYFLSLRNLTNMLMAVSVIGVMAAVSTLVMVSRSLDLSVGSALGLVGVLVAELLEAGWGWPLGLAAGFAAGALLGLGNALVVTRLRINSIIATIGTLSIYRGLAYILTGGQTVLVADETLIAIGSARVLGVPWAVLVMLLCFALVHAFCAYTVGGRTAYAIGANPRACRLSGVPIARYRTWIFVASGLSAALAGVLFIGQSGTAVPNGGVGYELQVITAVLLGGVSLQGGAGRVSGVLLGVVIIGVLNNGMSLLGVDSYYQIVANGALLLAAVALDQRQRGAPEDD